MLRSLLTHDIYKSHWNHHQITVSILMILRCWSDLVYYSLYMHKGSSLGELYIWLDMEHWQRHFTCSHIAFHTTMKPLPTMAPSPDITIWHGPLLFRFTTHTAKSNPKSNTLWDIAGYCQFLSIPGFVHKLPLCLAFRWSLFGLP